MLHFIKKLLIKGVLSLSTRGWTIISILLLMLYIGGYLAMSLFAETALLEHYTWWFVVTITTVGYGDVSPTTAGGQWTAIVIMILGIGSIALLIGKIAEWVIMMSEKQSKGFIKLKVSGHILIMGYREQRTDKLVRELLADIEEEQLLVICSNSLQSNPYDPQRVKFIRGEISSEDVLRRACCETAEKIIIMGKSDDQSFLAAFSVRHFNTHAHMVVFMNNEDHVSKIKCLPADDPDLNQAILPSAVNLIVQEIQDPQSSHVLQALMSNLNSATLYRLDIPASVSHQWSFETLFMYFRKYLQATILAVKPEQQSAQLINNPDMDMTIRANMSLFYVAPHRLKAINWQDIDSKT